jgi:hypothetical protein
MDTRLLSIATADASGGDLWIYFESLTGNLLEHPKFAIPLPLDQCSGSCKSVLLPGGLELARQALPWLNSSVFQDGIFNNADAIGIKHSRGIITTFSSPDSGFRSDSADECVYAGQTMGDLIQLCIAQQEYSIIAGTCFPSSTTVLLETPKMVLTRSTL